MVIPQSIAADMKLGNWSKAREAATASSHIITETTTTSNWQLTKMRTSSFRNLLLSTPKRQWPELISGIPPKDRIVLRDFIKQWMERNEVVTIKKSQTSEGVEGVSEEPKKDQNKIAQQSQSQAPISDVRIEFRCPKAGAFALDGSMSAKAIVDKHLQELSLEDNTNSNETKNPNSKIPDIDSIEILLPASVCLSELILNYQQMANFIQSYLASNKKSDSNMSGLSFLQHSSDSLDDLENESDDHQHLSVSDKILQSCIDRLSLLSRLETIQSSSTTSTSSSSSRQQQLINPGRLFEFDPEQLAEEKRLKLEEKLNKKRKSDEEKQKAKEEKQRLKQQLMLQDGQGINHEWILKLPNKPQESDIQDHLRDVLRKSLYVRGDDRYRYEIATKDLHLNLPLNGVMELVVSFCRILSCSAESTQKNKQTSEALNIKPKQVVLERLYLLEFPAAMEKFDLAQNIKKEIVNDAEAISGVSGTGLGGGGPASLDLQENKYLADVQNIYRSSIDSAKNLSTLDQLLGVENLDSGGNGNGNGLGSDLTNTSNANVQQKILQEKLKYEKRLQREATRTKNFSSSEQYTEYSNLRIEVAKVIRTKIFKLFPMIPSKIAACAAYLVQDRIASVVERALDLFEAEGGRKVSLKDSEIDDNDDDDTKKSKSNAKSSTSKAKAKAKSKAAKSKKSAANSSVTDIDHQHLNDCYNRAIQEFQNYDAEICKRHHIDGDLGVTKLDLKPPMAKQVIKKEEKEDVDMDEKDDEDDDEEEEDDDEDEEDDDDDDDDMEVDSDEEEEEDEEDEVSDDDEEEEEDDDEEEDEEEDPDDDEEEDEEEDEPSPVIKRTTSASAKAKAKTAAAKAKSAAKSMKSAMKKFAANNKISKTTSKSTSSSSDSKATKGSKKTVLMKSTKKTVTKTSKATILASMKKSTSMTKSSMQTKSLMKTVSKSGSKKPTAKAKPKAKTKGKKK